MKNDEREISFESLSPSGHWLTYTRLKNTDSSVKVGGAFRDGEWLPCCDANAKGLVIVPSTVLCNNIVYTVEGVAYAAFAQCSKVESVILPYTIREIEPLAFIRSGITQISIPEGVQCIEPLTFQNCSRLKKVTLPQSIREIGFEAFSGCVQLEKIEIPLACRKIGDEAFRGCKKNTHLMRKVNDGSVQKNNGIYSDDSGMYGVVDTNGNTIIEPRYSRIVANEDVDYDELYFNVMGSNCMWGLADVSGNFITDFKYDSIEDVFDRYAVVRVGGKYGVINNKGTEVLCPQYDEIGFFNALEDPVLFPVREDGGKWKYLRSGGVAVTGPIYDRADPLEYGLALVSRDGKWGFINNDGVEVIGLIFDAPCYFDSNGRADTVKNGSPVVIDTEGNIVE